MNPQQTNVETTCIVMPPQTNFRGNAFGGWIMAQMDLVGAICATKFCNNANVVTVNVDDIQFTKPIHLGDIVIFQARVNWTGNTSLEVGVRVIKEDPKTNDKVHCLTGFLTFVLLDDMGKPTKVPAIDPTTDEDKRRFNDAIRRKEHRLARKIR